MKIEDVKTDDLISDYKEISDLEEKYFEKCKQYDADSVYESDPVLIAIQLELGRRQIYLSTVEDSKNDV